VDGDDALRVFPPRDSDGRGTAEVQDPAVARRQPGGAPVGAAARPTTGVRIPPPRRRRPFVCIPSAYRLRTRYAARDRATHAVPATSCSEPVSGSRVDPSSQSPLQGLAVPGVDRRAPRRRPRPDGGGRCRLNAGPRRADDFRGGGVAETCKSGAPDRPAGQRPGRPHPPRLTPRTVRTAMTRIP